MKLLNYKQFRDEGIPAYWDIGKLRVVDEVLLALDPCPMLWEFTEIHGSLDARGSGDPRETAIGIPLELDS